MATYAYTDNQGRKITQGAYNAQKQAGTDVSGYKPIATVATPVVETPAVTSSTDIENAGVVKPSPTDVVLPFSKDTDTYKTLVGKGYTDQMIVDAYNKVKSTKTPEQQANLTKQETQTQPAVNVNIQPNPETKTEPAKITEPVKTPQQIQAEADAIRYSDDSEARTQEIVNNLNTRVATNPEALKTLDAFKKAYSYDMRSDIQKQTLDNRYAGYQKGVKLGLTPISDIISGYPKTITDIDLESLKISNPNKYAEVQTAIENKKALQRFKDELYGTKTDTTDGLADTTVDETNTSLFDDYKAVINSEEVKTLQTDMADKNGKITQLQRQLNDIQKDVEKRYEGTGATKGKIAYIVAKEQAELQNQVSELSIDYNTAINKYNSIVNTAKDTMTMGLQEQQAEQQERAAKMQELGFYYQYDPTGMAERADTVFNIENPDIDSENVNTARRALNNELTKYYEKYGDIIIRPQSQALNDILLQAKTDGTSLSAALKKNFTDQLQSKQLYGQTLGKSLGFDMGSYSMSQGADGNWRVNAKNTSEIRNINGVDYSYNPATDSYSTPNTPYSATTYAGSGMAGAGLRNNNPGNIKDTTFGNPLGTDAKGFAQFATPEDGFDALVAKVQNSQTNPKSAYYGKTIAQYIAKYAPSSDNNNPIAYAQSVANALGVSVNTKVSDVDATKFAGAIAKHDSGYDYKTYGQFRGTATNGNAPTPAELLFYNKGTIKNKPTDEGITQSRYNEIAAYQDSKEGGDGLTNSAIKAVSMANFSTEVARKAAVNDIQNIAKSGDVNGVQTKLKNIYKQNLGTLEGAAMTTNENTINALKQIAINIKDIPTSYLKGGLEKIAQKFGDSTDPKLAKGGISMNNALDILRRGRSGAALTEFEEEFYNAMFPTINKNFEFNTAAIEGLTESMQNNIDSRLSTFYGQDVYNNIRGQPSYESSTPQTNFSFIGGSPSITPRYQSLDSIVK